MSIADLRAAGVDVEVGYISTFLITPSQVVTSKDARGMTEEQRQCRFFFESQDLKLFKDYSQSSCLFECQLKYASLKCQCVPWNYPQLFEDIQLCNYVSQNCFEKAMGNTTILANCSANCPYDCATTRYQYSVSSTAFDIGEFTLYLKITEKVSFNIASEASYVYILNGQKFIINALVPQFLSS